jgi:hypothetical protein
MRKLMLGAVVALAFPAAALAQEPAASAEQLAATACKTEKAEMGAAKFKLTYGAVKSTAKAKENCLAQRGIAAEATIANAAHACRAERQSMGAEAFAVKYAAAGTNHNGRNAHGKCVSSQAKAKSEAQTEARVSAADSCKQLKAGDAAAFTASFGEKRNAFGKCVAKTAKELEATEQT